MGERQPGRDLEADRARADAARREAAQRRQQADKATRDAPPQGRTSRPHDKT